ncbi:thioesterase family protein [Enterococcus pingfangensis]|uniref:thioesterase family protein n=1 Tax=Enterococcus pingfangensis TaxID=2559924 RepID=UPI0010F90178|nr:thioesterase family protein [Enterococcus pingfangensis]
MKKLTKQYQVQTDQTAVEMGSGDLNVLATPALVAMMENCAKDLLADDLSAEQTSVGVAMNVKHLAPTAVGATVAVEAELLETTRNKRSFSIKAFDKEQMIGEGTHQRVIVETDVFLKKLK